MIRARFVFIFNVIGILYCCSTSIVLAQPKLKVVLHQRYADAGLVLRIENSGIYGLRGITASSDGFILNTEVTTRQYKLADNGSARMVTENLNKVGSTFIDRSTPLAASAFINNVQESFIMVDGTIKGIERISGSVSLKGRERLILDMKTSAFPLHYEEEYPGNLAFSDVIGVDSKGFVFVEVQLYVKEVPLQVQRQVLVLSPSGELINRLLLPQLSYCTTERDLQIDASGRLYCLLTDESSLIVACWSNLNEKGESRIIFPAEFNRNIHFNYFLKKQEPLLSAVKPLSKITTASRTLAISIADSYIVHHYTCSEANLVPNGVTGPDGDVVQTPSWLVVGRNAHLPYMWGGFSTVAQFDAGLVNGKYAGDINTVSVSGYAVSVDCSGYVSRCWQLSSHYSTSMMPDITTQLASWDQLKPADGILDAGSHVRLFIGKSINGYLRVAESSARDWGVSYWSYTPAQLTSYVPVSYNQMEWQYSMQQPELVSAISSAGKNVLTWKCDTTNVLGYRLYRSIDGTTWTLFMNESTLKTQTISFNESAPTVSYRVSSVLKTTGNPESIFSNAMIVGTGTSSGKILIVDGFSRQLGSWRGPGHTFAVTYGMPVAGAGYSVETIKRSLIDSQSVSLQSYNGIVWIAGDQSTNEDTVLYEAERGALRKYLEHGGCLLISGSEIGYSVAMNSNVETSGFLNNYLKASYISDNAGTTRAGGIALSVYMDYPSINFAQTYMIGYPDVIAAYGGSELCMNYSTGVGAGISYSGTFGLSTVEGKVIYIGFPLETIADETVFTGLVTSSMDYFFKKFPTIKSTSPSTSDTAVLISNGITILFSTAMDTQSVKNAFSITPSVPCSFFWTNNYKVLTIIPIQSLLFNTTYTIQFNSTLRSANGYGLDQNNDGVGGDVYALSFKTESALFAWNNPVVFSQVAVGELTILPITIRNRSTSSITISSVSNKKGIFQCTPPLPLTIKGGDSIQTPVSFKPQAYGTVNDTLFVNSSSGSISIALSGSSPIPSLYVSRSSIGYGSRVVGTSTKGTFYVTSLSINPVRVDSIKLRTAYFQPSSYTMPQTLKLYDTLKIDLTFVPDAARSYTDSVIIYTNSPVPIYRISLTGYGVASSSVEANDAQVPNTPMVFQNYPNPFNPTTSIPFWLPERAYVTLKIFSVLGREVATLVDGEVDAGTYVKQWNAAGYASGMYFYRLQAGSFCNSKKLILLK